MRSHDGGVTQELEKAAVDAARYRVKEVSALSGVSVRTLHYYEEIGLLVPTGRSSKGYRLYDAASLRRLQQILLHRELGLSLEEVRRILDDEHFDELRALAAHRERLVALGLENERKIAAIDAAMKNLKSTKERNEPMETEMTSLFDGFDPQRYETEAASRWGDTDAFRESARRTKAYGPKEWAALRAEFDAIHRDLAELRASGAEPDSPEVLAVVERHRGHIERWFYPCDRAMHLGLAALYESDPRFAANIDRFGEGLTAYLARAIRAQA